MPYQINRYNGQPLVTVDEGTLSNEKTTLRLVGKNYAGYGDIQNENFVFLTENFSNTAPPPNALSGQIWYDSASRKLKFWDAARWRSTGGAEIGPTEPTGLTVGDFWWNTSSNQLYTYDGVSQFVLIGPQAVPGAGQTLWESLSVLDDQNNRHVIMRALIDDKATHIISKDSFNLSPVNPIVGFSFIKQGMTLVDTNTNGSTTSSFRHWGTASDSDRLGTHLASEYVFSLNAIFQGTASFDDSGFTVGNDGDLAVFVDGGTIPTIQNLQSNLIKFIIKDGLTSKNTMQIVGGAVDPGITDTYDLGEPTLRWRNIYARDIYADNFHGNLIGNISGIAAKADTLKYARASTVDKYRIATDENTGDTIVARDSSGNFSANVIDAIATRARYADLAEKYEADTEYEPGTVVVFGGDKEITVTTQIGDHRVAGVVSTNPAYIMNVSAETEGYLPVALRGKVPVKVIGTVTKGDVLVASSTSGYAVSGGNGESYSSHAVFAKALENKDDSEPGVVMAVVV